MATTAVPCDINSNSVAYCRGDDSDSKNPVDVDSENHVNEPYSQLHNALMHEKQRNGYNITNLNVDQKSNGKVTSPINAKKVTFGKAANVNMIITDNRTNLNDTKLINSQKQNAQLNDPSINQNTKCSLTQNEGSDTTQTVLEQMGVKKQTILKRTMNNPSYTNPTSSSTSSNSPSLLKRMMTASATWFSSSSPAPPPSTPAHGSSAQQTPSPHHTLQSSTSGSHHYGGGSASAGPSTLEMHSRLELYANRWG